MTEVVLELVREHLEKVEKRKLLVFSKTKQ